MSVRSGRLDAGAAVAGLFDRPTATGGLAGGRRPPVPDANVNQIDEPRIRLGVELSDREIEFLRSLSRPARTGGRRTLGSKFVGTGVLSAAIEILQTVEMDMQGVIAGDLAEMKERARMALMRAAERGAKQERPD